MNLSDVFEAAAYKELVAVDLPARGSNQHEINGVAALREFFGTATKFQGSVTWHFFADDAVPLEEVGEFTFYDARAKHPKRTEWRLYYSGEFPRYASEGDVLVLLKTKHPKELLHALIFKKDSSWLFSTEKLFGVSNLNPANFENFPRENLATRELGIVAERILEELGFESLQIPSSHSDIELVLEKFGRVFPTTKEMSLFAREQAKDNNPTDADQMLVGWLQREERLFRALERVIVEETLQKGFADVDSFIAFSLSVNNRRKSRMGYSLQNQLAALFNHAKIRYEAQSTTEGKNKPDFIFPGAHEYHNPDFDPTLLTMLGAKSTLKERWRQILTEARKIPHKHLCTLELAISKDQTNEIANQSVQLVIPAAFHETYTSEQQIQLWTVSRFLEFVRSKQN